MHPTPSYDAQTDEVELKAHLDAARYFLHRPPIPAGFFSSTAWQGNAIRHGQSPLRDASTVAALLSMAEPVRLLLSSTRGGWRRRRLGHGEALAHGEEASGGSVNEEGDGRYSPSVWVCWDQIVECYSIPNTGKIRWWVSKRWQAKVLTTR
jgi:hypothetical protein